MITKLNDRMVELYVAAKCLFLRQEGQDVVEYSLLVVLVALAATISMNALAGDVNTAFSNVAKVLSS